MKKSSRKPGAERGVVTFVALTGAAFALLTGPRSYGADADTESGELKEVIVTGSLIRRTDSETPSPVQVITQKQMQESGYTNVSDVLRSLSANGAGTLSQAFSGAFAGGASGVSLRGLTVGATLTLIDGQRMVDYPLTDDGQRTFVDVSAIPFNTVDRIEVLKDGASAEYGSDAIAGVVNVILKKNYIGTEVSAEAGTSQKNDGTTEHLSGISGLGDLASDGYNAYISFDFHHQDDILLSNRHGLYTNLDWTGQGGINTTYGAANDPLVPYPYSITGYLINPNTASGTPYAFLPGCNATAQNNNQCTYFNKSLQIQPTAENINVLGKFTKSLGSDWQASLTASVFNSSGDQAGLYPGTAYPGGLYNVGLEPGAAPVVVGPNVITVPANYPGNTFGAAAPLVYNFHELNPVTDYDTNTYRAVLDINGTASGWNLHGAGGMMYAQTVQRQYGDLELGALQTALNNGYIVGEHPSPGGAALFAPAADAVDTSTLNFLSFTATRPLLQLPGGPLSLGTGVEYVQKILDATAPPAIASGVQAGNNAYAIGSQDDAAAFAEFDAAVFKQLELNAAVRYDHYDTYGGSTTPKFGIKYTPIEELAFRGTWGKGFRAPNPAESGKSGSAFLQSSVADPILCPNGANTYAPGNYPSQCAINLTGVQLSNPKLLPETSTNLTLGAIFAPVKSFSVSADYYMIKIDRDIISLSEAGGLLNSTVSIPNLVRGPQVVLPYVNANGTITNQLTPVGEILYQPYPYVNATQDKTSGFDVDLEDTVDLGTVGKLTTVLSWTHILEYDLLAYGVTYQLAGTHGPSGVSGDTGNPRDRATLSLTWDRGPASVTATVNYVGAFNITDPSNDQYSCSDSLYGALDTYFLSGQTYPASYCEVHHFTDLDLYGSYALGKHASVHASIMNLFNTQPPLDLETYGGAGNAAYDTAFHQAGAIGRFFTIGGTYTF